jgi:hypothetical protein
VWHSQFFFITGTSSAVETPHLPRSRTSMWTSRSSALPPVGTKAISQSRMISTTLASGQSARRVSVCSNNCRVVQVLRNAGIATCSGRLSLVLLLVAALAACAIQLVAWPARMAHRATGCCRPSPRASVATWGASGEQFVFWASSNCDNSAMEMTETSTSITGICCSHGATIGTSPKWIEIHDCVIVVLHYHLSTILVSVKE